MGQTDLKDSISPHKSAEPSRNAHLRGAPNAWELLDTPALCVDLDALTHNIHALQTWSTQQRLKLRPHAKTHKCSQIAQRQCGAGAIGVGAATLKEAEVMLEAGVGSVLLTSPVVGTAKLQRLARLLRRARGELLVTTDSLASVAELNALTIQTGQRLGVLVEHHAGQGRSGCETPSEVLGLAHAVHSASHLELCGLQHYFGHLQHIADPIERKARVLELTEPTIQLAHTLRAAGLPLPIISGAGTGTFSAAAASGLYTEIQAGSYVFMDAQYADVLGPETATNLMQSLFVAARVCSIQSADTRHYVTIDAGQKALSIDAPGPRLREATKANSRYAFFGDEHGRWYFGDGELVPKRGTRVDITPGHCDPTVALHDELHVFKGHLLVDIWPIDARGY